MRRISITTQQKIMFIPYINWLNTFIWLYNYHCAKYSLIIALKSIVIEVSCLAPFLLIEIFTSRFFPDIEHIVAGLNSYFMPLSLSWALIKFQKKLEINPRKNQEKTE